MTGKVDIFEWGEARQKNVKDLSEQKGQGDGSPNLGDVGGLNCANDAFVKGHEGSEPARWNAHLKHFLDRGQRVDQCLDTHAHDQQSKDGFEGARADFAGSFTLEQKANHGDQPQDHGRDLD
jgi:hypothetical protein